MTTSGTQTSFSMRLLGAMALDVIVYEEVEADRSATTQAFVVVILSSLAAGIGARGFGAGSLTGILFITALSLLSWATWAIVTLQIGTRLLPTADTHSDAGELLRTIGFSAAPGILRVFGVVPGAAMPAFAITAIWMLASMVVAVRQALDYESTGRAIAVCVVGWTLAIAIAVTIGLAFGPALS